ncbi:MAG: hypothetical protein OHK0037_20350 [Elainellaceae cyanobacterium]
MQEAQESREALRVRALLSIPEVLGKQEPQAFGLLKAWQRHEPQRDEHQELPPPDDLDALEQVKRAEVSERSAQPLAASAAQPQGGGDGLQEFAAF